MNRREDSTIGTVLATAIKLWPDFFEQYKVQLDGRTGLYLTGIHFAQNSSSGVLIGTLPSNKIQEKIGFSFEKMGRLINGLPQYYTSFPTQNYLKKKYGGAIRTATFALSASGLSKPDYDHEFVLRVLNEADQCMDHEYEIIKAEFERCKDFGK